MYDIENDRRVAFIRSGTTVRMNEALDEIGWNAADKQKSKIEIWFPRGYYYDYRGDGVGERMPIKGSTSYLFSGIPVDVRAPVWDETLRNYTVSYFKRTHLVQCKRDSNGVLRFYARIIDMDGLFSKRSQKCQPTRTKTQRPARRGKSSDASMIGSTA